MGGGAVAEPAVELGGVLELLAAEAGDGEVMGLDGGQAGHVHPEFFKLADGEDVLLAVAPAFFDVLEGDVGGHAGGEAADGGAGFGGVPEVVAGELENREQGVDVDPAGIGVVVGEVEFVLLVGHGEAFDELEPAIHAGEAAAAVFEAARDDLEGEPGAGGEVLA